MQPQFPASSSTIKVPQQATGPIEVSIDDDPMLGDKNARVTVIDFSRL